MKIVAKICKTLNKKTTRIIVKWKTEGMEEKLAFNASEIAFQFSF